MYSQKHEYDSLALRIKQSTSDTAKIKLIYKLADGHAWWNAEKILPFTMQGLQLSQKLNDKKWEAMMVFIHGYVYSELYQYKKTLEHYSKALLLWKRLNDTCRIADCLNNMGIVYWQQKKLQEAKLYYDSSLSLYDIINDTPGIIRCKNNLAIVAKANGAYKTAIANYFDVLSYHESKKNRIKAANVSLNIGVLQMELKNFQDAETYLIQALQMYINEKADKNVIEAHNNLGILYSRQFKYEKALLHYKTAQNNLKKYNDVNLSGKLNLNIGATHKYLTEYDSALHYFRKALIHFTEAGDKQGILHTRFSIVDVFLELKNFDSIEFHIKSSHSILDSIESLKDNSIANLFLANYNENRGNYKEALHFFRKYVVLNDSVYDVQKNHQLLELSKKYETEKKQHQISLLEESKRTQSLVISRNKWIILSLTAAAMFLLFFSLLWHRYTKQKAEQASANLNHRLLRSQLNPHFLFNSLISLHNSISNQQNDKAIELLNGFTFLMRQILENSKNDFITLADEIKLLEEYLKLQSLRFENKFTYSINVLVNHDSEVVLIPPMLGQPFVENAIEHGFKNTDYQGTLQIKWEQINNDLIYTIEDNGKGIIKQDSSTKKTHKSRATEITYERLNLISKKYKRKATLTITEKDHSGSNACGVIVKIRIPLVLDN